MNRHNKPLVFVVEDDSFFLEILKSKLSNNEKYNLIGFDSAEACLKKWYKNPDVIVLDYNLDKDNPKAINGIEAIQKIKEKLPLTKVIMLSGQNSFEVASKIMELGVYDYVIKDTNAFKILSSKILNALFINS